MRQQGIRIDQNAIDRAKTTYNAQYEQHLGHARYLAGSNISVMAPESFADALTTRGLYPPKTPKTNKPSITRAWLKEHKYDPLVKSILEARRYAKALNTFIEGTEKYVVQKGNVYRIYPEFPQLKRDDENEKNKMGTIARFASRHPNMQNQPIRDEEIGPVIRGFFIPEEDGIWERHDMSQIEFRALVHYARGTGAAEARHAYNTDPDTDFHKLAAQMFGADPDNEHDRSRVKTTNFCKVYFGGPDKLALTIGCTYEEARKFSDEYDRRLPFVRITGRAAMQCAQREGFVRTVLGRRQRFDLWESAEDRRAQWMPHNEARAAYGNNIRRAFTHAALNRVLQGSAADIFKKSLVMIWQSGICNVLGAPLINVHDENNWSVPKTTEAEEAIAEARNLMETSVKLNVPLRVNWKRGANWGEC
jgi:DNA polymerase I-like protein with 3'-5' exonuclease and polymerase domains